MKVLGKVEKVSCVDCEHCFAGLYSDYCDEFHAPCSVPSQGKTYAVSTHKAWIHCRGKKFKPRRPWWKRLLGLA